MIESCVGGGAGARMNCVPGSFLERRLRRHVMIAEIRASPATEENGKDPGTSFSDEFVRTHTHNHTNEFGKVDYALFTIGRWIQWTRLSYVRIEISIVPFQWYSLRGWSTILKN